MKKLILAVSLCLLFAAGTAQAELTNVWYEDGRQDPLRVPEWLHELGNQPPFPNEEWIKSSDLETNLIACTENYNYDNPLGPNILVSITNMTGKSWIDLWYVADPETSLTNDDGWVNRGLAFKIDNIGINIPLVRESITPNLIFEPGETWDFIIQEYVGPGSPSAFDSIGVGFVSQGFPPSTGSIIAVVPEPGTLLLLGSGLLSLLGYARKRFTT